MSRVGDESGGIKYMVSFISPTSYGSLRGTCFKAFTVAVAFEISRYPNLVRLRSSANVV
jgi:hypothetical protein